MQTGARAIKENKISAEEVDLCLSNLQESIDSQKEVQKALGIFSFTYSDTFESGSFTFYSEMVL